MYVQVDTLRINSFEIWLTLRVVVANSLIIIAICFPSAKEYLSEIDLVIQTLKHLYVYKSGLAHCETNNEPRWQRQYGFL